MENPRQGLQGAKYGYISPAFPDVCPTHYACITGIANETRRPRRPPPRIPTRSPPNFTNPVSADETPPPPPLSSNRKPVAHQGTEHEQLTLSPSPVEEEGLVSDSLAQNKFGQSEYKPAETSIAVSHTSDSDGGMELDPQLLDYDEFYSGRLAGKPEPHEAFVSWDALRPHLIGQEGLSSCGFLHRYVPQRRWLPSKKHGTQETKTAPLILEVGCGSSALGAGLVREAGVHYIGVDAVQSAVDAQAQRYPDLHIVTADARALSSQLSSLLKSFHASPADTRRANGCSEVVGSDIIDGANHNQNLISSVVDVVLDKGTADALFLYSDPDTAITSYLEEVRRILRPPHGVFIIIACARSDGILHGSGPPRLSEFASNQPKAWRTLEHRKLESDVGAGDRTYDLFALTPWPDAWPPAPWPLC